TLVTHAAIGSQVDQALDRKLYFATQIAFDGERTDVLTNTLEFSIGQVFYLFGVLDTGRFANFACARTTDAKNSSKSDFGVRLRRKVDASDTGRDCCLLKSGARRPLSWALLVTRVGADDAHHAVTFDDFAVGANPLYRCHYLHGLTPSFL